MERTPIWHYRRMNTRWESAWAVWKVVLGPTLMGTLPYPDVRRRRRIRREARQLVTCDPWPGNDASSIELAQLVLIRALWLQRETRRVARHREAAALLARVALENCFVGLYCTYGDDPLTAMRGGNRRAYRKMFGNLGYGDIITDDVLRAMDRQIGGKGALPDARTMSAVISKALGDAPFPVNLYWRMYVPLSELFVHASGIALLRHVGAKSEILSRPVYPWSRRCAVRTADGCMALVASAIAHETERPTERLAKYADDHLNRALAPLAVASGKDLLRVLGPAKIFALVKGVMELRAYSNSDQAESDNLDERIRFFRAWFEKQFGAYRADFEETWDVFVDRVVELLARPSPAANESDASASDRGADDTLGSD
jgi:hypothetical protein